MNNTDQADFVKANSPIFTDEEFNHCWIEVPMTDEDAEEEFNWYKYKSQLDNRVDIYSM